MTIRAAANARSHPEPTRTADEPPPRLNDATVVLWRDSSVVQLELGHRRLVIENVGSEQMSALLPLRSNRGRRHSAEVDTRYPIQDLRDLLHRSGFLTPDISAGQWNPAEPATPAHLMADLAALSTQFGTDAATVLRARRQAAVAVHGTSRLATAVAATLAAAGIGWVQLVHGGDVGASDACPGGLTPADEGRRFGTAAADAVRRAAPDVDTTPIPGDRSADLVVLTDVGPADSTVRSSLHLDGVAHLVAAVDGPHAVIGPLVIPGVTSCLRCADLHRCERDPAWPAIAVQLATKPLRRRPSDVALCVATAGVAVSQALAYLDRQQPATLEGTLEWRLPDWRLRRRSWPSHHECDCGAAPTAAKHGRMGA
jgi:hypothetical protein